MVQFVFTPWRDRRELLMVRRQFYPHPFSGGGGSPDRPFEQQHRHSLPSFSSSPSAASLPTRRGDGNTSAPSAPQRQGLAFHHSRPNAKAPAPAPAPVPVPALASQHDSYYPRALVDEPAGHGHVHVAAQDQHDAVARVSMWMQRGNCPHLVESTALLMAAILSDSAPSRFSSSSFASASSSSAQAASLSYAVRVAYSAAFSRFVTGLLDSHQDKQRKMSMYDVAKSVGLPATFVELRHQATHEQLPSLMRLRAGAQQALDWIWDYYWRHLADVADASSGEGPPAPDRRHMSAGTGICNDHAADGACRDLIMRYLKLQGGQRRASPGPDQLEPGLATATAEREDLVSQIREQDETTLLAVLASVGDSCTDAGMLRRVLELERLVVMGGSTEQPSPSIEGGGKEDLDAVRAALDSSWEQIRELEVADVGRDPGIEAVGDELPSWSLYDEDVWVPKPIGVV